MAATEEDQGTEQYPISAEEVIQELLTTMANLQMELAQARVVIRRQQLFINSVEKNITKEASDA